MCCVGEMKNVHSIHGRVLFRDTEKCNCDRFNSIELTCKQNWTVASCLGPKNRGADRKLGVQGINRTETKSTQRENGTTINGASISSISARLVWTAFLELFPWYSSVADASTWGKFLRRRQFHFQYAMLAICPDVSWLCNQHALVQNKNTEISKRYLKQQQITNGHRTILCLKCTGCAKSDPLSKAGRWIHCPKTKRSPQWARNDVANFTRRPDQLLKWDPGDLFYWTVGIIFPQLFLARQALCIWRNPISWDAARNF